MLGSEGRRDKTAWITGKDLSIAEDCKLNDSTVPCGWRGTHQSGSEAESWNRSLLLPQHCILQIRTDLSQMSEYEVVSGMRVWRDHNTSYKDRLGQKNNFKFNDEKTEET